MIKSKHTRKAGNKLEVRVRMYRQGLGDCFLIRFKRGSHQSFMLIDCGVFVGTEDQTNRMRSVTQDIKCETGGQIDLLVATHQHWDHLSGFLQAQDVWDDIEIARLWLAWTEKPDDGLARKLRGEQELGLQAARLALDRFPKSVSAYRDGIAGVIDFFGQADATDKKVSGTQAAIEYLRQRAGERICYLYPPLPDKVAEPIEGVFDGVRFYVLGPPYDEQKIKRSDPRKGEAYGFSRAALAEGLLATVRPTSTSDDADSQTGYVPFDPYYRVSVSEAKGDPFFKQHYGFNKSHSQQPWRRIDDVWISMTGGLALTLDSDTNNTSLALAIELVESGDVLLFPGDAQAGNWASWDSCRWSVCDGNDAKCIINVEQLLNRVVFYKVGHHGSHNATLQGRGLELMTNKEKMVAFIPVDREVVNERKWKMPFPPLETALLDKTMGRLLLGHEDELPPDRLKGLSPRQRAKFNNACEITELFVDYTLMD
ncbi:MAG TPA: MBL fold metallo-hydrolase [Chloroflexia bacterium]|jgi:hypothetical protein